jgi:C1A family cysteine protease
MIKSRMACLAMTGGLALTTIGASIGRLTPAAIAATGYCSDIVASDTREVSTSAAKMVEGSMYETDSARTVAVGSGDSLSIATGTVQSPNSNVTATNFNEKSYDFATATDRQHSEGATGTIKQQNSTTQKQSTARVVGSDCRAAASVEIAKDTNRTQLKMAEMQYRGKLVDSLLR